MTSLNLIQILEHGNAPSVGYENDVTEGNVYSSEKDYQEQIGSIALLVENVFTLKAES